MEKRKGNKYDRYKTDHGSGKRPIVDKPVKKAVENLRKDIASVDKAFEKLDRLSERFNTGKEAEKGGRP